MDRAKEAKQLQTDATAREEESLEDLAREYDNMVKSEGEIVKPTIQVSKGTSGNNGWYRSEVDLTITPGTNSLVGVDRTTYAITGAQTTSETTGTSIKITQEGISYITAYTYDKWGNKIESDQFTVKKDTEGPVFAGVEDESSNVDTNNINDSMIKGDITVSDEISGVESTTSFTYSPEYMTSSTTTFTYTAKDKAGNTTTAQRKISSVCFVAGTKVSTPSGLKSIENVKVGDKVYSYNEEMGKIEAKTVLKTYKHQDNQIITIKLKNGEEIKSTVVHPYYVVGREWTKAEDVKIGDELLTQDGTKCEVEYVKIESKGMIDVYNIKVQDNHNYFVSPSNVLVHNKKA